MDFSLNRSVGSFGDQTTSSNTPATVSQQGFKSPADSAGGSFPDPLVDAPSLTTTQATNLGGSIADQSFKPFQSIPFAVNQQEIKPTTQSVNGMANGGTNGFNINAYTPSPQVNLVASQPAKPEFLSTGGFFAQETVYPEGKSVQTVQEARLSPLPAPKADNLLSATQLNESSKRSPSPSTTPKDELATGKLTPENKRKSSIHDAWEVVEAEDLIQEQTKKIDVSSTEIPKAASEPSKKPKLNISENNDQTETTLTKKSAKEKVLPTTTPRSSTRQRKGIDRLSIGPSLSEPKQVETFKGDGAKLGDIAHVAKELEKRKSADASVVLLHRVVFGRAGDAFHRKSELRKFNGFGKTMPSLEERLKRHTQNELKGLCILLNIERSGEKAILLERISEFLKKPRDLGASKAVHAKKQPAKKKVTKKTSTRTKKVASPKDIETFETSGSEGEEELIKQVVAETAQEA